MEDAPYPPQPRNVGSTEFRRLMVLFERLQEERKYDKKLRMMGHWFDVRVFGVGRF